MSLPLVIIAAVAENRVIGRDNKLLWRLKSDLKRFRALTIGKPVIMGRKTFDSIGKPLPGRETIVITRDAGFAVPGVTVCHSFDAAVVAGEALAHRLQAQEIMIAGGAEIYAAFLARAKRLELTEVALSPEGDAVFPDFSKVEWRLVSRQEHKKDPDNEADFAFLTYERTA